MNVCLDELAKAITGYNILFDEVKIQCLGGYNISELTLLSADRLVMDDMGTVTNNNTY